MRPGVVSRRLWLALAASLLLHLVALFGHRLDLSTPRDDLVRLEMKLVRTAPELKPAEAPPPPEQPKPKKKREQPREAPPQELPQAQLEQPPTQEAPPPEPEAPPQAEDTPEAQPSPTPPETPKVAGTAWPRAGRIVFAAYMGEQRFEFGKSTHEWEVADDGRYRLVQLSEPVGVAMIPWFKTSKRVWVSTGRITEAGLQPERFVDSQEGKPGEARADLNWETKELTIAGAPHVIKLPDGTQDMLSFFYQLGYPGAAEPGVLPVTTGRKLEQYRFETVGEGDLALPFGKTWRTQHVRARYGNEVTEVWLARDFFGLPVQIRRVDGKGVVYYLVAAEVMVAKDAVDRKNP